MVDPQTILASVGTVSLIKDAFELALKGYGLFATSAAGRQKEGRSLAVQISIERYRFELYGRNMGLLNSDSSSIVQQPVQAQQLVQAVMEEIAAIFSDTDQLYQKYCVEVVAASNDVEMQAWPLSSSLSDMQIKQIKQTSVYVQAQLDDNVMNARPWSSIDKIRWACKDVDKATHLLETLRNYNQSLWTTLSPHHSMMLERGLPSLMLPGINDLAILATVNQYSRVINSPGLLTDCANLRAHVLSVAEREPVLDMQDHLRLNRERNCVSVTETSAKNGTRRGIGTVRVAGTMQINVLIEYKNINPNIQPEERMAVKNRLRQLVELLSHERSSDLGLLPTIGFISEPTDPLLFGMVFKLSQPTLTGCSNVSSLENILLREEGFRKYGLEDRFALALALANAILQLHSSGWLHKSLKPHNIVFEHSESQLPRISAPRILGFDVSRPDRPGEKSLVEASDRGFDRYRHAECQGVSAARFQKRHDYFAIGVLLLIIGVWEPVEDIERKLEERIKKSHPQRDSPISPTQWAEYMTSIAEKRLWSECGKIYRDVTIRCLKGDFGVSRQLQDDKVESQVIQRAFLFSVVDELAKCVV